MALEHFGGVRFNQVWVNQDGSDLPEIKQPLLLCRNEQQPALSVERAALRIDSQHGLDIDAAPFLRLVSNRIQLLGPSGLSIQAGGSPAPALTVSADGNVAIGTTERAANLELNGDLAVTGVIHSPQWRLIGLMNDWHGPLPRESRKFTTHGGALLLLASGSGWSHTSPGPIGMAILLDGSVKAQARVFANHEDNHLAFTVQSLVVAKVSAGEHTITLRPLDGTLTDSTDYYTLTAVELPCEAEEADPDSGSPIGLTPVSDTPVFTAVPPHPA